jgi:AcrR family transcriptional regulator
MASARQKLSSAVQSKRRQAVDASGPTETLSGGKKWSNQISTPRDQYELKREAAIEQALRAFGRRGFKNTSLGTIAEALNVSKPALYYYFEDKQELLYECHKLSMEIGDRALEAAINAGGTGLDKVLRFVSAYVAALTGELSASAVLDELDELKPDHRRLIEKRRREFDRSLRSLVDEGISDGSIRACDSKFIVFWFMGAIHGIPGWFRQDGAQTGAQIAEKFTDFIRRGVG